MGTIAATVTKNQLQTVPLSHPAVTHAVVAGYSAALQVSTVITLIGFVIALLVIRSRPQPAIDVIPDAA